MKVALRADRAAGRERERVNVFDTKYMFNDDVDDDARYEEEGFSR